MKLVVVIMGQNCEKFIRMCLDSVKDADAIVYCDGGSTDLSMRVAQSEGATVIENPYEQKDLAMNGKQRNFYLNYVKENYPDYWCLALDADEVVEDLSKIKEFINKEDTEPTLYSVRMRHFISDLGHEDATEKYHFVLNRLFKIDQAVGYPEVEHPVLQGKSQPLATECTTIWHLAYIPNLWEYKNKYVNHLNKSNMHTPSYLKEWYYSHLFGYYQKTQIDPVEIPKIILDEFLVDKDEFYFRNRGLEVKHFLDAMHWKDHFKPKTAVEFGCGLTPSNGYEVDGYRCNRIRTK